MVINIRRDDWESDKQFDAIKRIANAIEKTTVVNTVFTVGMIQFWYGAEADCPDEWAICNGSNGTPDMRGLVPIGVSGSYALGATGGATSVTSGSGGSGSTDSGGSGTSGSGGGANTGAVTLTLSQIPSHGHRLWVDITTGFDINVEGFNYASGGWDVCVAGNAFSPGSGASGYLTTNNESINIVENSGGGGSHEHTTSAHTHSTPAHSHTIGAHTHSVATMMPYRALHYIMYIGP